MPNDASEDATNAPFPPFDDDLQVQREKDFADWCDELAAVSADFEPRLKGGIKVHIELQPLRWINSGLDLIRRSKQSLLGNFLPYPVFQMGAELFLKGMWLCQFEECRLLGDEAYITELKRQHYLKELKTKFGHDLLKAVAELRLITCYRDDAATARFLKVVESVIRTFYFPLYEGDKRDQKWANCRYPKRFYNDIAQKGDANAWNKYPQQWLVAELFEQMRCDIFRLWDFSLVV